MVQFLETFFQVKKRGSSVKRELLAGCSTFATMAYVLFVYPLVLSQTGMDEGAIMAAVAITAALSTLCMGLFANYPFALAPSMGMNAYLTYSIILGKGHSWQVGIGACFFAGVALLVLNIVGFRKILLDAIPKSLRIGVTCGIGLFLATIGLRYLGVIAPHPDTCVAMGNIATPEALLGGIGLLLMGGLHALGFRGAILFSILALWGIGLAIGLVEWQGVISLPPSLDPTFLQLDLFSVFEIALIPMLISVVFVSVFEASGSLVALAEQGNFFDGEGKLEKAKGALYPDALGTMVGPVLGTGPVTNYLESASGIAVGGKTGLVSIVVAILFLGALFFTPLVMSLPHFATAPALILLGAFLLRSIEKLNWEDSSEYLPAFAVLLIIPMTMNIAAGIAIGFVLFSVMKLICRRQKEVHPLIWVIATGLLVSIFVL